jgi:hypothetical protein
MTSTQWTVLISCVVLALAVMLAAWLFARRAEMAANQAKTYARNAHAALEEVRGYRAEMQQLVTHFRNGAPADVDYRPTCPMDGEPLADFRNEAGRPARYVHADGTSHLDRMAGLAIQANMPAPALQPGDRVLIDDRTTGQTMSGTVGGAGQFTPDPPMYQAAAPSFTPDQEATPSQAPAQSSNVDTYFQRVSTAEVAGLIDPDRLVDGIGDITRNPEFAQAMQDIADRTRAAEQGPPTVPDAPAEPRRRMPDPSKAARVRGSRLAPRTTGPLHRNGDGS